ncbi:MAG: ribosomal protein S18-alanine N-acetyltransferase [Methermicoccaceae archaeon]
MLLIRPFNQTDYPDVLNIERVVFSDRRAEEYMAYYLVQREHFFVAQLDSKVVGYAVGYVSRDTGKVFSIAVHPAFRGRGIGKALLIRLLGSLLDAGAVHVLLEVRVSNIAAQRLYTSVGFVQVSTMPMYYPDGEDAYVYLFTAPLKAMSNRWERSS